MTLINNIVGEIKTHRCYHHPVFRHWAANEPSPDVIGALFHQIRSFCDSTRPGLNLPMGLNQIGLSNGSSLLQEIVESEEDHGPHLATMAGHILNISAGEVVCSDLYDQTAIECKLKECSDRIMGSLPGYDNANGLMPQTRRARAVFERRERIDRESIYSNLGTTLALEIVSNRHLIPGEKYCLVDSGLYGVQMNDPEMHYLLEHFGECGAEAKHEQNAIDAVSLVVNEETVRFVTWGVGDFLESLAALWDLLDSALLQSGEARLGACQFFHAGD